MRLAHRSDMGSVVVIRARNTQVPRLWYAVTALHYVCWPWDERTLVDAAESVVSVNSSFCVRALTATCDPRSRRRCWARDWRDVRRDRSCASIALRRTTTRVCS
jgi:hypothetical protein